MRLHSPVLAGLALALAACGSAGFKAQAGYTQMSIEGDIALNPTAGGGTGSIQQDIETALGLGEEQGNPWVRAEADLGVVVFAATGFTFEEQGTGTLQANYGNITAGTDVNSDLELANVKASMAFQIELGPLSLAPGLAVDWFDLTLDVSDTAGIATESVELSAPVPMVFLRGQADVGMLSFIAEAGYLKVPEYDDIEATSWDAEALVELRPTPLLNLFAGYRMISMELDGEVDNQDFFADITLSGWIIGGGVRF
jgi:hypothetical protein